MLAVAACISDIVSARNVAHLSRIASVLEPSVYTLKSIFSVGFFIENDESPGSFADVSVRVVGCKMEHCVEDDAILQLTFPGTGVADRVHNFYLRWKLSFKSPLPRACLSHKARSFEYSG